MVVQCLSPLQGMGVAEASVFSLFNAKRFNSRFDSTGSCLRLDRLSRSWSRFGERSSYRGHPSDRHVYNHSNVEPEWIEPEYNVSELLLPPLELAPLKTF